jgi:hypothetical protein
LPIDLIRFAVARLSTFGGQNEDSDRYGYGN